MKSLGGRVGLSGLLVAIGAAAALFGTAKTLAEALTGRAFSLADLAYYTGNAAMVAYYCVTAFGVACIALLVAADRLRGRWTPPCVGGLRHHAGAPGGGARGDRVRRPHVHLGPGRCARRRALFARFVGIAAVAPPCSPTAVPHTDRPRSRESAGPQGRPPVLAFAVRSACS